METSKLHNIIISLTNENAVYKYSNLITNLVNSISQNQIPQIEKAINEIEKATKNSSVNNLSISGLKILDEIGGTNYFGIFALNHINKILSSTPYNNSSTIKELQSYNNERNEFIKCITQLNDSFDTLRLDVHFYDDDTYEVGLLFPEEVTNNTIKNLNKNLHKWDLIFKTLKEITGNEVEDTKISLVNNGSLEFFTENTPQIAICLAITLERLATLYKRIIEIRLARKKLAELGAPKTETDTVEKHEKSEIDKEINGIVDEILKKHSVKLEAGRKNELKTALTGHVKFIAKSLDKGITIEITPPDAIEPDIINEETTDENKSAQEKEKKLHDEKIAKIEVVNKSTKLVKEIVKTGNEVFKYLTNGEEDIEEDK